jgi:hypothetical protein
MCWCCTLQEFVEPAGHLLLDRHLQHSGEAGLTQPDWQPIKGPSLGAAARQHCQRRQPCRRPPSPAPTTTATTTSMPWLSCAAAPAPALAGQHQPLPRAVRLSGRHTAAAVAHQDPLRALVGCGCGGCGGCGRVGLPQPLPPRAATQLHARCRSWDMWQMRGPSTPQLVRCASANATSAYRHFLGNSSDPAQFSNMIWFEADPADDTRVYGWSQHHVSLGCSALIGYVCEVPASIFACFPPPVPPPKPPSPPSPPAPPAPPSCEHSSTHRPCDGHTRNGAWVGTAGHCPAFWHARVLTLAAPLASPQARPPPSTPPTSVRPP